MLTYFDNFVSRTNTRTQESKKETRENTKKDKMKGYHRAYPTPVFSNILKQCKRGSRLKRGGDTVL